MESYWCLQRQYSSGCPVGANAATGWPGVIILPLVNITNLACNFCLSLAIRRTVLETDFISALLISQ